MMHFKLIQFLTMIGPISTSLLGTWDKSLPKFYRLDVGLIQVTTFINIKIQFRREGILLYKNTGDRLLEIISKTLLMFLPGFIKYGEYGKDLLKINWILKNHLFKKKILKDLKRSLTFNTNMVHPTHNLWKLNHDHLSLKTAFLSQIERCRKIHLWG